MSKPKQDVLLEATGSDMYAAQAANRLCNAAITYQAQPQCDRDTADKAVTCRTVLPECSGTSSQTRLLVKLSRLVQRSLVLLVYLQGRRTELLAAECKLIQHATLLWSPACGFIPCCLSSAAIMIVRLTSIRGSILCPPAMPIQTS